MAVASDLIAINPADGADPLAIFPASSLHRQSKQDLLFYHIGEFESKAFIEANLRFSGVDPHLFRVEVLGRRTIKQVETLFQRQRRRGQTAVAIRFHCSGKLALDPDFAAGMVASGVAVGVAGALVAAPAIRHLLYETPPNDPATLIIAAIFVTVIGFSGAAIPAIRATRVEPAAALRYTITC